jgi:putative endonuclease
MQNYYCYLITTQNRTYIGITNNLENRLEKHNSGLGAKSTRMAKNWRYHTIMRGFKNKSEVLAFEWYWKHIQNKNNKWRKTSFGIRNKMIRLLQLLLEDKWNDIALAHPPDK